MNFTKRRVVALNVAGVYHDSITNGEGWRSVLFVSGCPHRCEGCHNPNTWKREYGTPYNEEEVFNKLTDNELLDGVTISGGEPFLYTKTLLSLVKKIKEKKLDIWVYTGYVWEELLERAENDLYTRQFLETIDVIVDGRFEIEKKKPSLKFRGSTNQRIIDVKVSIKEGVLKELDLAVG